MVSINFLEFSIQGIALFSKIRINFSPSNKYDMILAKSLGEAIGISLLVIESYRGYEIN